MTEEYVKANNFSDPVYKGLFWAFVDDSPHNQYLCFSNYLDEQLKLLRIGKMPAKE